MCSLWLCFEALAPRATACREAQLLTEIGELKEAQRRRLTAVAAAAAAAPECEQQGQAQQPQQQAQAAAGSSHSQVLDGLHRDLFLAAAQHLLQEFSAKVTKVCWAVHVLVMHLLPHLPTRQYIALGALSVDALCAPRAAPNHAADRLLLPCSQAEGKATALDQRLQQAEAQFGRLSAHCTALQAQLGHATEQCRREEQAVQALLGSNMRLHESMLQLMEQTACAAAAAPAAAQPGKGTRAGRGSQQQYQRATQASLRKQQQQPGPEPGSAAGGGQHADCDGCGQCAAKAGTPRQPVRRQLSAADELPGPAPAGPAVRAARSLTGSRQGLLLGASAEFGPPASSGKWGSRAPSSASEAQVAVNVAARAAAVEATLAISTEHRELLEYYKVAFL